MINKTKDISQQRPSKSMAPFFLIWTGQALSLLGSQVAGFALVWYLTTSTGSATVLALASMVTMLPKILLGPVAGTLVDRWNRRIVMIVADSLIALATAGLMVLFFLGVVQVWHIYGLAFIRALGGVFHHLTMEASTTLMVPEKHLSRVQGMNQTLFGAMGILSPALGALLLDLLPMHGILAIDVATAPLAILPLFFVFIPQPTTVPACRATSDADALEPTELMPSVLDDLREGLRFIWGQPGLAMIVTIHALVYLLMVPAYSLLPLLVTEHFGGGALQLAWLQTAGSGGIIVGGLILSVWGGFRRRIVTMLLGQTLSGVAWVVLGVTSPNGLLLAIVAQFFSTAMNSIMVGSIRAVWQATVQPEMQGRTSALSMAIVTAMTPIGLAIAGPLAEAAGVQVWFVVGGLVTTALGVGAFFIPVIMQVEDKATENQVEAA